MCLRPLSSLCRWQTEGLVPGAQGKAQRFGFLRHCLSSVCWNSTFQEYISPVSHGSEKKDNKPLPCPGSAATQLTALEVDKTCWPYHLCNLDQPSLDKMCVLGSEVITFVNFSLTRETVPWLGTCSPTPDCSKFCQPVDKLLVPWKWSQKMLWLRHLPISQGQFTSKLQPGFF
jgi:hypothetical protein